MPEKSHATTATTGTTPAATATTSTSSDGAGLSTGPRGCGRVVLVLGLGGECFWWCLCLCGELRGVFSRSKNLSKNIEAKVHDIQGNHNQAPLH